MILFLTAIICFLLGFLGLFFWTRYTQKSFEVLLSPISESMAKLDVHQRALEEKRAGAYASLSSQIESMMRAEEILRKETIQLSSALRSPTVRGAWGQVHLRRVVELAGLQNQCDFVEQLTVEAGGKSLRPDLVVRLPGQRHIVIDAKAPLNAYLEGGVEAHAQALRKHMRDLSQKDYWKHVGLSPEFTVLFLPAESFFSAALQVDPQLIEVGAEQNVIVATPTTLIAVLRAIAHSWKQEALSKNAEEIARLGKELYERLALLADHWGKVGKSLSSAVEAYNQSISSLESRVLVSARKLKEHGAGPLNEQEISPPMPVEKLTRT